MGVIYNKSMGIVHEPTHKYTIIEGIKNEEEFSLEAIGSEQLCAHDQCACNMGYEH